MSVPDISLPSDANASGRSLGQEELDLLKHVIESGTLNCTKGTTVSRFEKRFAELVGAPFCRCTTSGTAAIHAAVAAVNPDPGDEIITTSITDMGAITPILYQTAIPVFADVDPHTYNVTADTIRRKITRRTRAVIVTHIFGNRARWTRSSSSASRRGSRSSRTARRHTARPTRAGTWGRSARSDASACSRAST